MMRRDFLKLSEVVLASVYFYENLGYRNIRGAYFMHTENVQG